jgi:5'-deoxynucleotidase YfbR-like HD superfamily hydrolase
LAEHLFNVTIISRCIGVEARLESSLVQSAANWALIHDVPEVVCGDTPTPTKRRMKEFGGDFESMYDQIDPEYAAVKAKAKIDGVETLVKAADLMEALHFLSENGVGRHAEQITHKINRNFSNHIAHIKNPAIADACLVVLDRLIRGDIYE